MTVILFGIIRGVMMHVTLVEINVHDDKVEQFIDVCRQNHLGTRQRHTTKLAWSSLNR